MFDDSEPTLPRLNLPTGTDPEPALKPEADEGPRQEGEPPAPLDREALAPPPPRFLPLGLEPEEEPPRPELPPELAHPPAAPLLPLDVLLQEEDTLPSSAASPSIPDPPEYTALSLPRELLPALEDDGPELPDFQGPDRSDITLFDAPLPTLSLPVGLQPASTELARHELVRNEPVRLERTIRPGALSLLGQPLALVMAKGRVLRVHARAPRVERSLSLTGSGKRVVAQRYGRASEGVPVLEPSPPWPPGGAAEEPEPQTAVSAPELQPGGKATGGDAGRPLPSSLSPWKVSSMELGGATPSEGNRLLQGLARSTQGPDRRTQVPARRGASSPMARPGGREKDSMHPASSRLLVWVLVGAVAVVGGALLLKPGPTLQAPPEVAQEGVLSQAEGDRVRLSVLRAPELADAELLPVWHKSKLDASSRLRFQLQLKPARAVYLLVLLPEGVLSTLATLGPLETPDVGAVFLKSLPADEEAPPIPVAALRPPVGTEGNGGPAAATPPSALKGRLTLIALSGPTELDERSRWRLAEEVREVLTKEDRPALRKKLLSDGFSADGLQVVIR